MPEAVTPADPEKARTELNQAFRDLPSGDYGIINKKEYDKALVRVRDALAAVTSFNERMETALIWYAEQAAGCRKITDEGETARNALDADGGRRAREALTAPPPQTGSLDQGAPNHFDQNARGFDPT